VFLFAPEVEDRVATTNGGSLSVLSAQRVRQELVISAMLCGGFGKLHACASEHGGYTTSG